MLARQEKWSRKSGTASIKILSIFTAPFFSTEKSKPHFLHLNRNLAPDMAEQLQVADVLFDPSKDKDLTAEYARFRELTKELSSRPEDIRLGSADFAKVVFFLDHYSRMNLWSEFFPIPPEVMIPKNSGEPLANLWLARNLSILRKSRKWTQHDFASTLQELVSMEPTALKARLLDILENQKMDPTSLVCCSVC